MNGQRHGYEFTIFCCQCGVIDGLAKSWECLTVPRTNKRQKGAQTFPLQVECKETEERKRRIHLKFCKKRGNHGMKEPISYKNKMQRKSKVCAIFSLNEVQTFYCFYVGDSRQRIFSLTSKLLSEVHPKF